MCLIGGENLNDSSKTNGINLLQMQTYVYKRIEDYKEEVDDRKYDRYITTSIDGLNEEDLHKIIYFSQENIYVVYTKMTLEMVCFKKYNQWNKRKDS